MADWEEIKRLAADFQRVQLSGGSQRLSERNCVDLVRKLQELKLLDVIYTTDGKEYLTPQELEKEIREELQVHGGRINLVELQQILNVDFRHVESKVNEIVKASKNLSLVLGQLIDESYLDNLAEEINDKVQEQGQITVGELTKCYDLPTEVLQQTIKSRLGTIIKGQTDELDKNILFTESFVARQKAKVRGAVSAITQPTNLSSIIQQFALQERLLYTILEDLIKTGRVAGTLSGGRQDKALYVPDIYSKSQNEWVDSFFAQNGYLEYDAMVRIGITDPKSFIKKRLKKDNIQYLSTCCVGTFIQEKLEAEVEEVLASGGWMDIMPVLPSIVSENDASQMLQKCLKTKTGAVVLCDVIVCSEKFLLQCRAHFDDLMKKKAEKDVKSNPALLSPEGDKKVAVKVSGIDDGSVGKEERKDQRRKKAAGGGKGGGTQGRESKTKAVKKKGRGRNDDSDDESSSIPTTNKNQTVIEFMDVDEMAEALKKQRSLEECPENLVTEIAEYLHRPLTKEYQQVVRSVFLQTQGGATSVARKKIHEDLQEKINGLWTNVRLFEKGIKFFSEETQVQLSKHLLKTMCTDIANLLFNAVATDNMMSTLEGKQITPEIRLKLLSKMPEDKSKTLLTKIHTSLNGKTLDDFFMYVEQICSTGCLEIVLRKPDKKKERQLVFNHRQALASQLKDESDPGMTLHLAVVTMFQVFTNCMVHAPGRCVPQLVEFLREHISEEWHQVLFHCQELVVKNLKLQQSDDPEGGGDGNEEEISHQLKEILPKVKDIALSAKKSGNQNTED